MRLTPSSLQGTGEDPAPERGRRKGSVLKTAFRKSFPVHDYGISGETVYHYLRQASHIELLTDKPMRFMPSPRLP